MFTLLALRNEGSFEGLRPISASILNAWYQANRALKYVNLNEHILHSTAHVRRSPHLSALLSQEQSKRPRLRQASDEKRFPLQIPRFASKLSRCERFAQPFSRDPSRTQTTIADPLGHRRPCHQSRPRPGANRSDEARFRLRHRHERRRTHP